MLEIFKTLARSVFGMNHVANHENQYLEIVGNGLDAEHPRNARTLDIAGNEVLAGRLTVGAQPEGDNDVATKKYVDDNAGDELPAVTATDNGNVLTVVEGAWAKAAPSGGGGGVFPIGLVWDDEASVTVMNKTVQEIMDAANSGKMLWVYHSSGDGDPIYEMYGFVSTVWWESGYNVSVATGKSSITVEGETINYLPTFIFSADSLTGYPSSADF